jgi:hypothetical protein
MGRLYVCGGRRHKGIFVLSTTLFCELKIYFKIKPIKDKNGNLKLRNICSTYA